MINRNKKNYIQPDWPAPSNIHAFSTTREGGVSMPPFDSLNLAEHVGDDRESVLQNRARLKDNLNLLHEPVWLEQVHGQEVVVLDRLPNTLLKADAAITRQKHLPCVVMTADCLPVLLCDKEGEQVAAIHAGWRGLAAGIITQTIKQLNVRQENPLIAWLGPAIGSSVFEVGQDVYDAFESIQSAFEPLKSGKYLADIFKIASYYLKKCGVSDIYGGEYCTYTQSDRFFSYRHAGGQTGRMATLIWIT